MIQLVAMTDVAFADLEKIRKGGGSREDQQRAMAVLVTQLVITQPELKAEPALSRPPKPRTPGRTER